MAENQLTLLRPWNANEALPDIRQAIAGQLDSVWRHSHAVCWLREAVDGGKGEVFIVDIDSSFYVSRNPEASNRARQILEKRGGVIVSVTSRTPEMGMSHDVLDRTKEAGFRRRGPRMKKEDEGFTYVKAEEFPEKTPIGVLDLHVIAGSTGTQMMVRCGQRGEGYYYLEDTAFQQGVPAGWRAGVTEALERFEQDTGVVVPYADIDRRDLFEQGRVDVMPPEERIQLNFVNVNEMKSFVDRLEEWLATNHVPAFEHSRFTEDSKPPFASCFIHPHKKGKGPAVLWTVYSLAREIETKGQGRLSEMEVWVLGDSPADFEMFDTLGILPVRRTVAVLAAGSVMSQALSPTSGETCFATLNLEPFKNNLAYSGTPGVYHRQGTETESLFVVGDEFAPQKLGPETLIEAVTRLR